MTTTDEQTFSMARPLLPQQAPPPEQPRPQARAFPQPYPPAPQVPYAQTYPQAYPRTYPQAYPQTHQPPYGPPAGFAPGGLPLPVESSRRPVALIVMSVVAVLVLAVGAVLAMVFLFGGPSTVDGPAVEREIVRITQDAVHVAPTDVHCPADVELARGGTFTCTATLDSQPITYTASQTDDRGSVTIQGQRVLQMSELEATGAEIINRGLTSPARLDCRPTGSVVLVNDPGTPVTCLATRIGDPTDTAEFVLTIDAAKMVTVKLAS